MVTAEIAEASVIRNFISHLALRGALTAELACFDDLIVLYHKVGGGMDGIVNTIGGLGKVSDKKRSANDERSYQTWIKAHHGVAQQGDVYIAAPVPSMHCENLVVVIDAEDIRHTGDARMAAGKYLFREMLETMKHKPSGIVLYIINKNYQRTEGHAACRLECRC